MGAEGSDQQLDALSYNISECVEGAVRNRKGIVRVRFEGLLINTGQCDARHRFRVMLDFEGEGECIRDEERETDYILLLLPSKDIHSYGCFYRRYPTKCPQ